MKLYSRKQYDEIILKQIMNKLNMLIWNSHISPRYNLIIYNIFNKPYSSYSRKIKTLNKYINKELCVGKYKELSVKFYNDSGYINWRIIRKQHKQQSWIYKYIFLSIKKIKNEIFFKFRKSNN